MARHTKEFQDTSSGYLVDKPLNMEPITKPNYNKTYVGVVKDNRDVTKSGKLRVFIPELGGSAIDETNWITVSYCSPFGGATPPGSNKVDGTQQKESQQSYGMWMVSPDIGNYVVVLFINGEPNKGIYIGNIFHQNMNNMIPALGSSDAHNSGPALDGQDLAPPTTESNKRDSTQDPANPTRPRFEPLHRGLEYEGLYIDGDRGPSTASSRRESPSQVFGLNSPRGHHIFIDDGEIETEEGTGKPIMDGNQIVRKGLANEYIRLRTKGGTQILINDTLGYIYLNSKLGNSWVEISDEGISLYTAKNFNIRAQENMNIRVDGNLNFEVLGKTQWVNGGDFVGLFKSGHHTKVDGELRISTAGSIGIGSKSNIVVGADGQIIHTANRIIHSAGRIDLNSFGAGGPPQAADVVYSAQRDRKLAGPGYPEDAIGGGGSVLDERGFVTHEPWNYHQRIKSPNTSESTIGVITQDCPPPETNPNTDKVDPVTEETPPAADDPRVDSSVGTPSEEFKYQESDDVKQKIDQYEQDAAEFHKDAAQVAVESGELARKVEAGEIDIDSPEFEKQAQALEARGAANLERGQELERRQEAISREVQQETESQRKAFDQNRAAAAGRVSTPTPSAPAATIPVSDPRAQMSEIVARENAAIAAKESQLGRALSFSEKTEMMTESAALRDKIVNDLESRTAAANRNQNPTPTPAPQQAQATANKLAEYEALRAREAGRMTSEEARLGRKLTEIERQNLSAGSRALARDIQQQQDTAARRRANTNPGSRTALPIVVDYTQNFEDMSITLANGAVIPNALKDPSTLSISEEMFNKIRSEYPFRSGVATVKETGVRIIGHGTQVTDDLVAGLQSGVLNIGNTVIEGVESAIGGVVNTVTGAIQGAVSTVQNVIDTIRIGPQLAEQMLRARVGQVEDVLRSSLKVPVTQNQFDSMVSLGEHIGPEQLAESPVVANINNGNVQGAVDSYNCYTHGGEAARRRRGEAGTMASGGAGSYEGVPPNSDELGALSSRYESNGDPTAIGYDSTGGHSYGEYQIATKTGTMDNYMKWAKTNDPETYNRLQAAGGAEAAKRGDPAFKAAWKQTMSDPTRAKSQHDFIAASHYTPAANRIAKSTGIDVSSRSKTVQDVLWSTSVQHGAGGADKIFQRATANLGPNATDEEIVRAVYAERGRNNGNAYFGRSTQGVRTSVVNRFNKEQADALAALRREQGAGTRTA